jgi:hypothetical protein
VTVVDDIDEAPDDDQELAQDVPDKNALSHILVTALREIDELGGPERHTLSQVLGRQNYDRLLAKPKVAQAINNWQSASDKTKGAATRVLALAIARASDAPELADRIEREIRDASEDYFNTGTSREVPSRAPTPSQIRNHAAAVDQRRNGQRVAYEKSRSVDSDDLAALAKRDDGTRYIQMRRKQMQKELRK